MEKKTNLNMSEESNLNITNINNSSFDDEKFIDMLFAEYVKSYNATKEGQVYPQWLNDEQLKWVLTIIKKNK